MRKLMAAIRQRDGDRAALAAAAHVENAAEAHWQRSTTSPLTLSHPELISATDLHTSWRSAQNAPAFIFAIMNLDSRFIAVNRAMARWAGLNDRGPNRQERSGFVYERTRAAGATG